MWLFYSFFKSLVGKEVVVELKNDLAIRGVLHSVDQYLNIKLHDIHVLDEEKYPHLLSVRNCFIRGSVIRYVQIPAKAPSPSARCTATLFCEVVTELLQDSARIEAREYKASQQ
ncbi:snRNP core protein SMX5d, putative [Acanthamoeba castellanii str. Neff]|uniref:SnRNP core protein SMX5d, putative n=1 Tax=Acanthamoeba castellanii (strain ATCC 30010 / Neff) TaxID=1257118 RepID=L8GW84_ACACF|nr:snRNP core protein SMX5d, putative [Acanthamoeba castellanii str. Neff]ELR16863.1 snRNP core protein SMX5d, putative [Acanthamoeba castellanii str. Neff]